MSRSTRHSQLVTTGSPGSMGVGAGGSRNEIRLWRGLGPLGIGLGLGRGLGLGLGLGSVAPPRPDSGVIHHHGGRNEEQANDLCRRPRRRRRRRLYQRGFLHLWCAPRFYLYSPLESSFRSRVCRNFTILPTGDVIDIQIPPAASNPNVTACAAPFFSYHGTPFLISLPSYLTSNTTSGLRVCDVFLGHGCTGCNR